MNRTGLDDEGVAGQVAKALNGLSTGKRKRMDEKAMTMDEQEELIERQQMHNVVVIDEVD